MPDTPESVAKCGSLLPRTSNHESTLMEEGNNNVNSRNTDGTARLWCFTWNNPDGLIDWARTKDDDGEALVTHVRYAVYQLEVGDNGTEHFQGYVEFDRSVRLSHCRRVLSCHWGKKYAHSTREQARAYAMKEDTRIDGPWEYGSFAEGGQGKRSDLDRVAEMVKDGKDLKQIALENPATFMRYHGGIARYMEVTLELHRNWPMEFELWYGGSGFGKSTLAASEFPDAYWKQPGEWWDGYTGQSVVIIDEFKGWLPAILINRLADATPLKVTVKGAMREFTARRVLIISNFLPHDWYTKEQVCLDAIRRRFTRILHWTAPRTYTEIRGLRDATGGWEITPWAAWTTYSRNV